METLDSMTLDRTINASCGCWFNQRFTTVARGEERIPNPPLPHFTLLFQPSFWIRRWTSPRSGSSLTFLQITEMGTRGFQCPAVTITCGWGWVLLNCGQRWSGILTRSLHPRPRPSAWLRQTVVVFADTIDWNTSLHILPICLLWLCILTIWMHCLPTFWPGQPLPCLGLSSFREECREIHQCRRSYILLAL